MKVQDVYEYINGFAPFGTQCAWDNSGLLLGDASQTVSRVLVCLDVTAETALYAVENGCGLIVSHHPVIFHALKSIPASSVITPLVKNGIAVISAHTNLDIAPGGVNDTLCETLGLPFKKCPPEIAEGFLNVLSLPRPLSAPEIALLVSEKLHAHVRYIDAGLHVCEAAVCGGSGGSFAAEAKLLGCGALITGDADHHDFLDAAALGVSLFAAGHFETENPVAQKLQGLLAAAFPGTEFITPPASSPVRSV